MGRSERIAGVCVCMWFLKGRAAQMRAGAARVQQQQLNHEQAVTRTMCSCQ